MPKNSKKAHQNNPISLKQMLGTIALASFALIIHACADSEPQATAPDGEGGMAVEELLNNSAKYVGQTVTVAGEIEDIIGKNLYKLEDTRLLKNQEILFLDLSPTQEETVKDTIRRDQKLLVTGEVRQLVVADLEREYGLTLDNDIRQNLETQYQGKPLVIAQSTQVIEE